MFLPRARRPDQARHVRVRARAGRRHRGRREGTPRSVSRSVSRSASLSLSLSLSLSASLSLSLSLSLSSPLEEEEEEEAKSVFCKWQARGCAGLAQLRLTGCRELTGMALAALARNGSLTDLSIADCRLVKDSDLCKLVGVAAGDCEPGGRRRRNRPFASSREEHEPETVTRASSKARRSHLPRSSSSPSSSSSSSPDLPLDGVEAWTTSRTLTTFTSSSTVPVRAPVVTTGCRLLTRLDVSGCSDVRCRGLSAIVARSPGLRVLTVRGCCAVGDEACAALALHGSRLRSLDLAGCPLVSERGVLAIARGVTGLDKLDVSDCARVTRRFLLDLMKELRFCRLARDFVGYQPLPDANERRLAAERCAVENKAATALQAPWRGALARVGLGARAARPFTTGFFLAICVFFFLSSLAISRGLSRVRFLHSLYPTIWQRELS